MIYSTIAARPTRTHQNTRCRTGASIRCIDDGLGRPGLRDTKQVVESAAKADAVKALGANRIVHRGESVLAELGAECVDVVVDLVGGDQWPELLDALRTGGRYVTSGAIAGPIVELDLRTLYLRGLTLYGSTYALEDIAKAQQDFLRKRHTGNLVLIPPVD